MELGGDAQRADFGLASVQTWGVFQGMFRLLSASCIGLTILSAHPPWELIGLCHGPPQHSLSAMEPDESSHGDVLWGSVEACFWVTQQDFGNAFSSSKK